MGDSVDRSLPPSGFIIMVDGDVDEAEVLRSVLERFPGAVWLKAHCCDVGGNWLEMWHNDDADSNLALSDKDGYLHYRWRVEVTPMNDAIDEDHQVELARGLLAAFESVGGRPVVLANFGDRV
jgi:hypothetical protein